MDPVFFTAWGGNIFEMDIVFLTTLGNTFEVEPVFFTALRENTSEVGPAFLTVLGLTYKVEMTVNRRQQLEGMRGPSCKAVEGVGEA